MTIQRQYTLPNCSLMLEGLSTEGDSPSAPMTVLMNMECHLPNTKEQPLSGGREFLESLVHAVNRYAQQLLSGVKGPEPDAAVSIDIKPGEGTYHNLIVHPSQEPMSDDRMEEASPRDIPLTTVQFFDLVDAIDQLVSDSSTLPDLTVPLQPVSRRFTKPAEPVTKRAAPAAIGASALAAAAVALFFVPVPEVERTKTSNSTSEDITAGADGANTATEPGIATEREAFPDAATGADVVDRLADAPPVDAATQAALQPQLEAQIQSAWEPETLPPEALSYRITASSEGDLLGYKYESDAALSYADETPLPELTYVSIDPTEPVEEPVAQFRVIFTPEGQVELTPWQEAPSPLGTE